MNIPSSSVWLTAARKKLTAAEHMAYLTLPLTQERRILIKILSEMRDSALFLMYAVLPSAPKTEKIAKDEEKKIFSLFRKRGAAAYGITPSEFRTLQAILVLYQKHAESPLEFVRKESFIILSQGLETERVDIKRVHGYLS